MNLKTGLPSKVVVKESKEVAVHVNLSLGFLDRMSFL